MNVLFRTVIDIVASRGCHWVEVQPAGMDMLDNIVVTFVLAGEKRRERERRARSSNGGGAGQASGILRGWIPAQVVDLNTDCVGQARLRETIFGIFGSLVLYVAIP